MDDVGLLNDVASFANEVHSKPVAQPSDDWREQLEYLDEKLRAAIGASGYRHIVGNFAPLLLQAIRKCFAARRTCDDRNAERFGALVGFLIEYVRADGRALLAAAKG